MLKIGWIFPYEDVEKDSDIIIYGAGKTGECIYDQIKNSQYCNVVGWVDKNYEMFQKKGMDVISPLDMQLIKYDSILIAVDTYETYKQIFNTLIDMNVSENKIIRIFDERDSNKRKYESWLVNRISLETEQYREQVIKCDMQGPIIAKYRNDSVVVFPCDPRYCNSCLMCMYICPTGAIYKFIDEEANCSIKINVKKCVNCKKCIEICSMNSSECEMENGNREE